MSDRTPFFPGSHFLGSALWDPDKTTAVVLGEVRGASRKWDRGILPVAFPPPTVVTDSNCQGFTGLTTDTATAPLVAGIDVRCWLLAGEDPPDWEAPVSLPDWLQKATEVTGQLEDSRVFDDDVGAIEVHAPLECLEPVFAPQVEFPVDGEVITPDPGNYVVVMRDPNALYVIRDDGSEGPITMGDPGAVAVFNALGNNVETGDPALVLEWLGIDPTPPPSFPTGPASRVVRWDNLGAAAQAARISDNNSGPVAVLANLSFRQVCYVLDGTGVTVGSMYNASSPGLGVVELQSLAPAGSGYAGLRVQLVSPVGDPVVRFWGSTGHEFAGFEFDGEPGLTTTASGWDIRGGVVFGLGDVPPSGPDPYPQYLTPAEGAALYMPAGADLGPVILDGAGAPGSATGAVGDYYVDTAAGMFYGPKGTAAAEERPTVANSPTATLTNLETGCRYTFPGGGVVQRVRYRRTAGTALTLSVSVYDDDSGGALVTRTTDTQAAVAGAFDVTLPVPVNIPPGGTRTFMTHAPTANPFLGATGNPVSSTANVVFVDYREAPGLGTGRLTNATRAFFVEPYFIPGSLWPLAARQIPPFTVSNPGQVNASGGGTVNFLRADGAWAVPPGVPAPGSPIRVRVSRSTDVALTSGVYADVIFNTKNTDVGNEYNTTTGRFTPAVTGDYLVYVMLYIFGQGTQQVLNWVTSSGVGDTYIFNGPGQVVGGTLSLHLIAGTSYNLSVFSNGATPSIMAAGGRTCMTISRLA